MLWSITKPLCPNLVALRYFSHPFILHVCKFRNSGFAYANCLVRSIKSSLKIPPLQASRHLDKYSMRSKPTSMEDTSGKASANFVARVDNSNEDSAAT